MVGRLRRRLPGCIFSSCGLPHALAEALFGEMLEAPAEGTPRLRRRGIRRVVDGHQRFRRVTEPVRVADVGEAIGPLGEEPFAWMSLRDAATKGSRTALPYRSDARSATV